MCGELRFLSQGVSRHGGHAPNYATLHKYCSVIRICTYDEYLYEKKKYRFRIFWMTKNKKTQYKIII